MKRNISEMPKQYQALKIEANGKVDFGDYCAYPDKIAVRFSDGTNTYIASVKNLPDEAYAPYFILSEEDGVEWDSPFYPYWNRDR